MELTLTPIAGRRWRVAQEWRGYGVTVPAGFETDLASIPAFAEPVIRRNELCWIIGGLVHDFEYRLRRGSRSEADALLRHIALAEGAPAWQAWVVWAAVRAFGARAWRR